LYKFTSKASISIYIRNLLTVVDCLFTIARLIEEFSQLYLRYEELDTSLTEAVFYGWKLWNLILIYANPRLWVM